MLNAMSIVFAEILHAIQTPLVLGLVLNYFWSLRDIMPSFNGIMETLSLGSHKLCAVTRPELVPKNNLKVLKKRVCTVNLTRSTSLSTGGLH